MLKIDFLTTIYTQENSTHKSVHGVNKRREKSVTMHVVLSGNH